MPSTHYLSLALEAVVPRSYPRVALDVAAARSFHEIRGAGRTCASEASTQTTGAPIMEHPQEDESGSINKRDAALLAFFVLGPILSTVYLARRARDRPALVGPGDLATRHLLCRRSRREMSTSAFVTGGEKQEPCPSRSAPSRPPCTRLLNSGAVVF